MLIKQTKSTIMSANKSVVHHLKWATNSREKYVIETFIRSYVAKNTYALL